MNEDWSNLPETIEVPEWVGQGLKVRRSALGNAHPQSYYNYIKNTLGFPPEAYGYLPPDEEEVLAEYRFARARDHYLYYGTEYYG